MILKHIHCRVAKHNKAAFSSAQVKWESLRHLDGFMGQFGGWDIQYQSSTHLFAFWKNRSLYKRFMMEDHDKIAASEEQKEYYDEITVTIYEIQSSKEMSLDFLKKAGRGRFLFFSKFSLDNDLKIFNENDTSIADYSSLIISQIDCETKNTRAIMAVSKSPISSQEIQQFYKKGGIPRTIDLQSELSHQIEMVEEWKCFTPPK